MMPRAGYLTATFVLASALVAPPALADTNQLSPAKAYAEFHVRAATAERLDDVADLMPSRYDAERRARYDLVKAKNPNLPTFDEIQRQTYRNMVDRYKRLRLLEVEEAINGRTKRDNVTDICVLRAVVIDQVSGATLSITPVMELEKGKWKYAGDRQTALPPDVHEVSGQTVNGR